MSYYSDILQPNSQCGVCVGRGRVDGAKDEGGGGGGEEPGPVGPAGLCHQLQEPPQEEGEQVR